MNLFSKCAPLAFACAALAQTSNAQQSVPLGKGAAGELLSYAVQDSLGTMRTVRTILTYNTPQTVADVKNVLESVSIEKIDCAKLTHHVIRYELYTSLQPGAAPALDIDISPSNSRDIPVDPNTDSAAAMVVRAVCQIAKTGTATASAPNSTAPPSQVSPTPQPSQSGSPIAITPTTQSTRQPQPSKADNNGTGNVAGPPPGTAFQGSPAMTLGATSSLQAARPFQDSIFTIGMLGKLAEYAYYDESKLAFDEAVLDKMSRGRQQTAQDGKQHPLLDGAWNQLNRNAEEQRAGMAEKRAFLAEAQLVSVPLPKIPRAPIKAFRAELYRHVPSGETVLVFRGTQEALDWLTNIWLGVDLLSIEAPHYTAAYDVVKALRKQNIKPFVVGHSLGAGLAQYTGFKFGLKVVGFNSSPLPERYFAEGQKTDSKYIRLFSAVETDINPATNKLELAPDPVSLDVPNLDAYLRENFIHHGIVVANQHLVKPDCIQSAPVPLFTEREQQTFAAVFREALSTGMVSVLVGGKAPMVGVMVSDALIKQDIKMAIKAELSAPIWLADSARPFDKNVSDAVKKEIAEVGVALYGDFGAVASIAKGGYNLMQDDWKKNAAGLGSLVKMAAKAAIAEYGVRHFLMPHSMNRFNRGMGQISTQDVFRNLPDQVKAQCQSQLTIY